jgi:DNA-binding IclR family transcriptional regulator
MTEEKLDEIAQQFGGSKDALADLEDEEEEDLFEGEEGGFRSRAATASPREELERRLAEARARRRAAGDLGEPLA